MVIAPLFEILGGWRQPKCPSLRNWLINYAISGIQNPKQLSKKEDARGTCAVKEKPLRYSVRKSEVQRYT